MPYYRVCGREWRFGAREAGRYSALTEGDELRAFMPDGTEFPAPPDALACAGKFLWEEGQIRTLPLYARVGGEQRMLLVSRTAERVTQVTAEAGQALFEPEQIPLACAHPLMDDPVPWGEKTVRLTVLRLGAPYAVTFLETAGDCAMIGHLPSLGNTVPPETTFLYVYAADEKLLYARLAPEGGKMTAEALCAAAAASVACGRCRPDTAIRLPFPDGEARVICRRDRRLTVTLPVA